MLVVRFLGAHGGEEVTPDKAESRAVRIIEGFVSEPHGRLVTQAYLAVREAQICFDLYDGT